MNSATRKRLASLAWPHFSASVEALNRNAQMFATIRSYENQSVPSFTRRSEMYAFINERLNDLNINYLEFGVWAGESLRTWTRLHANEESRFYGFDSFEGLPEAWDHGFGHATERQRFDQRGAIPIIEDIRVQFVKGWFQHTLRTFLQNTVLNHPIIVHIDSDLHSSALFTLCTLDQVLISGDIVIFDEYSSPSNEYLAWEEYTRAFMRSAECIAMSDQWSQVAFTLK